VKVGDIVSMVGMKGHALGRPLKLEKDCYDVYAICGFTGDNPTKSAEEFTTKFRRGSTTRKEKDFIERALERLRAYFQSENGGDRLLSQGSMGWIKAGVLTPIEESARFWGMFNIIEHINGVLNASV